MTTVRTNNLSPEFIAISRYIREVFTSPEFYIGGGFTTLAITHLIYNPETEQTGIIVSTAMGVILIVSGVELFFANRRTSHPPQRNPLPTPRHTLPAEPPPVLGQRNTPPTKSSAVPQKRIKPVLSKAHHAEMQRQQKKQKFLQSQAKSWWTKTKENMSNLVNKYRFTSQRPTSQSVTLSTEENETIKETTLDKKQEPKNPPSSSQKKDKEQKNKKMETRNLRTKKIKEPQKTSAIPAEKSKTLNKKKREAKNVYENRKNKFQIDEGINPAARMAEKTQQNLSSKKTNHTASDLQSSSVVIMKSTSDSTKSSTSSTVTTDTPIASQKTPLEFKQEHTGDDELLKNLSPFAAPNSASSIQHVPEDQQGWTYALKLKEENIRLKKQLTEEKNQTHYYYNLSNSLAADIISGVCYPYYYFFPPAVVPPKSIVVAATHSPASLSSNGKGTR